MAAPRLPFLWPMLFKPSRTIRTRARIVPRRSTTKACRIFSTSLHPYEESISQRYGTAHEPAPHLREQDVKKQGSELKKDPSNTMTEDEEDDEPPPSTIPPTQPRMPEPESVDPTPRTPLPDPPKTPEAKPLETVLHMPSPQEEEQRRPPHLKTPPYVHHFDTYSLVKDLTTSGFTQDQSVTVMKAVRGILTDNMNLAREGLVSKSNVENEAYLFRAACSELRTEMGNSRKAEIERMRSERNQLQHELDILGQKMGQETSHLKDELKGLFDDRKMAVRQEQRHMETKIQELGYKITIALNSDARSEVEGLRWILTRRAALTVGISAFMLFASLRYSSYVAHREKEQKKKDEQNNSPDGGDHTPSMGKPLLGKDNPLGGELLTTEGGVPLA